MSALSIREIPFVSSMQCYVCMYNKACKLQKVQLELSDRSVVETKDIQPAKVQCNGCKLLRYCSLKHLVEDREHRDICRALTDLKKSLNIAHPLLLNGEITNRIQLQQTIAQLMIAMRVKLGRILTRREHELIANPVYCVVCYSLEELTACTHCEAVAYCSSYHRCLDRVHHTQEACETLALCYSPYRFLESDFKIKQFKLPCDLERSYLVEAFHRATRIHVESQLWSSLEDYERFATCSSFSGISSICLALTCISFKAAPHETLSVYVVGAKEEHQRYFREVHLKFFFLQYQSVCQLDLYFIGNTLKSKDDEVITFNMKGNQRKVVKRTFSMTLRDFSQKHKVNPVLIMIYNPDFSAQDNEIERLINPNYLHAEEDISYDWSLCLREILYTFGVPICFTSPSKMQFRTDISYVNALARANKIAVNPVYDCEDNPYREILPYRNPCPDDSETVIYPNNYLKVFYTSIM